MGFVDTLKEFVGFGDVNDLEEEDYEMEDTHTAPAPQKKNKVVPLHGQSAQPKIVILKPKCFSNSTAVSDELKKRRPVVIDVGALDPDEARRVVDFIAGTVYGLDGNMQKVSGGIFLATPSQVDIMGEIIKDGDKGNFEWSMF